MIVFVTTASRRRWMPIRPATRTSSRARTRRTCCTACPLDPAVDLVRDRAVEEANADKALGTRILAIGVGNAFGGGTAGAAARGRLVAVSGPQVVTDANDITSLNEVDVALVEQFDELQDVLRTVVDQLCAPSLTILKLSQTAGNSFYRADARLGHHRESRTSRPATRLRSRGSCPRAPPGRRRRVATDADGFANFQWDPLARRPDHRGDGDRGGHRGHDTARLVVSRQAARRPVVDSSGTLDPV